MTLIKNIKGKMSIVPSQRDENPRSIDGKISISKCQSKRILRYFDFGICHLFVICNLVFEI